MYLLIYLFIYLFIRNRSRIFGANYEHLHASYKLTTHTTSNTFNVICNMETILNVIRIKSMTYIENVDTDTEAVLNEINRGNINSASHTRSDLDGENMLGIIEQ